MQTETKEKPRLNLAYGAEAIADFWGLEKRQFFNLASKNKLPGVFKIAGKYACDLDVAREAIRSKAEGK